jgi:hypothetical protein
VRSNVFLSRPAVLTEGQERVFSAWSSSFLDLGFQLERLRRHQYSDEPWEQLRKIFARIDGMVAFGFSQANAETKEWEDKRPEFARTSPWVHIETAMAIEKEIPVLVVAEPGVKEGVFGPSIWRGCLFGVPAGALPSRSAIPQAWIDAVHLKSPDRWFPG